MDDYKNFYQQDSSGISIEHWEDCLSVEMHQHTYYELFLICKGSCIHFFNDQKTLLIPGDCFLVPPHHSHGFDIHNQSSIFNCQFYAKNLSYDIQQTIDVLCSYNPSLPTEIDDNRFFQANINKQGIIHLSPNESGFIFPMFDYIFLNEKNKQDKYDSHLLKKYYIETILILLKKTQDQQYKNYTHQPKRRQTMITNILAFIENNLTEDINFIELAAKNNVSPNHFRKIFKDITGLTPIEYTNRLRVTKACNALLTSNQSVSHIAASVGIYDSNYFSRLFKQYMGCSPRYYHQ